MPDLMERPVRHAVPPPVLVRRRVPFLAGCAAVGLLIGVPVGFATLADPAAPPAVTAPGPSPLSTAIPEPDVTSAPEPPRNPPAAVQHRPLGTQAASRAQATIPATSTASAPTGRVTVTRQQPPVAADPVVPSSEPSTEPEPSPPTKPVPGVNPTDPATEAPPPPPD